MTLQETLAIEIKQAMKAKEAETLHTLRGLKAALQNEEIKQKRPLTKEEELSIVNREVKQTKEELTGFQNASGSYATVVEKLERRVSELTRFLPKQLTNEEVETVVQEAITSLHATSKADMGKVMTAVMPSLKGKADGKVINQTVKRLLEAL